MYLGEWICSDPDCGRINYAINRKVGQEIGIDIAKQSRGLFSADDWQCCSCMNINWARRTHCNRCNTPKVRIVEERNGYGGGYNDRQHVEYIKRDDTNDDYDDYGRKKRSKGREIINNKSADLSLSDISDDDEDLSKYDLSECNDTEILNDYAEKYNSRSRSRSSPNTK
ncbi:hypothetical protein O3M35_007162 [Rhynocoris fuscipes]|uniref:RanBP2-type domain-containing protein n=1 Tax=Rhynocoris fuscipes TaxID=488301 RepID=A0AAW1D8C8_9HEMI